MQKRNWKEFTEPAHRRTPGRVQASINPDGEITFDLATFRKLGEPSAMCLMYDAGRRTIGVKPISDAEPHAIPVRARHERSNRVVRSVPFLRENRIKLDRTLRFPFACIEDGTLVLDLRTALSVGKSPWRSTMR